MAGKELIQFAVHFDQSKALELLLAAGAVPHNLQQLLIGAINDGRAKALDVLLPGCAKGVLNLDDFNWKRIPNAAAVLKALLDHSETLGLTMQKDICRVLSIPNAPAEDVEVRPGTHVRRQLVCPANISSDIKDVVWHWIVSNYDKDGILAKFENSDTPFDLTKFNVISNHFIELKCISATELLKDKIVERYFLLNIFDGHTDQQTLIEILKFHVF